MISAEEAFKAWKNGEQVYWVYNNEETLIDADTPLDVFLTSHSFELKPRTITINGVEVGRLVSAEWNGVNPEIVSLEFNSEDEARWFQTKALEIFNDH